MSERRLSHLGRGCAVYKRRTTSGLNVNWPSFHAVQIAAAGSGARHSAHFDTKAARVIALLKRPAGATLNAIMALMGWQAHSVRAFITAHVRHKMSCPARSFTRGERVYCILPDIVL